LTGGILGEKAPPLEARTEDNSFGYETHNPLF